MSEGPDNKVPEGWVTVSLSDVTQSVPNVKPHDEPDREFGYVDISSICNETFRVMEPKRFKGRDAPSRARRPIQNGDVVFSNVRTYLRNIALIGDETEAQLCSTGFTVLRPSRAILPQYLFRFVLSDAFIDAVTPEQTGTHYPATSDKKVLRQTIPLPPLAEQRRIVAKVEEALGHIDAARQRLAGVPKLLARFRQSVLAAACSGRLTADWREERHTDNSEVEEWHSSTIGDLFKVTTGGTPSRANPDFFNEGTIPWVKTGEVKNCDIFAAEEHITQDAINKSSAKVFPAGTLLVALYGEGKTRGQIGRLMIDAATNQACAALINPKMNADLKRYVYFFLLSQYIALREKSAGGNQPNLSVGLIRSWEIQVPGLAESREVVRRVEKMWGLIDVIEQRLTTAVARADRLAQSVFAKAFRGELVPTEADLAIAEGRSYEPAAALLERIKRGGDAERKQVAKLGEAVLYLLLLLDEWGRPVHRRVLMAGLVLMLNPELRRTLDGKKKSKRKAKQLDEDVTYQPALDAMLGNLATQSILAVTEKNGRQAVSLGVKAPRDKIDQATVDDRETAKQAIGVLEKLSEQEAMNILTETANVELEPVS